MGWTSCASWNSAAEVAASYVGEVEAAGWRILARSGPKAGQCWLAVEYNGEKAIVVVLIEKSGGEWGYKAISERAHPYYYDCPKKILDLVPPACPEWRSEVEKRNRRKTAKYAVGAWVVVDGNLDRHYTVVAPPVGRSQRWTIARAGDGRIFTCVADRIRPYAEARAEREEKIAAIEAAPFRVISAWGDWQETVPKGSVGALATQGGNREGIGEKRWVLVPAEAYATRSSEGYALTGSEPEWTGHP